MPAQIEKVPTSDFNDVLMYDVISTEIFLSDFMKSQLFLEVWKPMSRPLRE